jgi:hypothetical protein
MTLNLPIMRWTALLCLSAAVSASPAAGQCRLCAPAPAATGPTAPARPISITIDADLDFSRAAQTGGNGGVISIEPGSGSRTVSGALQDLGGPSLRANVRITGEPMRHVRIQLPTSVTLNSAGGNKVQITNLATSLGPDPVIGPTGTLDFSFGGKLQVSGGVEGDFHGRVQIMADYQ